MNFTIYLVFHASSSQFSIFFGFMFIYHSNIFSDYFKYQFNGFSSVFAYASILFWKGGSTTLPASINQRHITRIIALKRGQIDAELIHVLCIHETLSPI